MWTSILCSLVAPGPAWGYSKSHGKASGTKGDAQATFLKIHTAFFASSFEDEEAFFQTIFYRILTNAITIILALAIIIFHAIIM